MNDLQNAVIHTLSYFGFFQYAPTFEEVYMFLSVKITRKKFQKELKKMVQLDTIQLKKTNDSHGERYTLGEYSIRVENSQKKIQKAQTFISVLSWFPQIRLIGLSGSVAMMNANENDDIDLFIITAKGRMWTARIIALFLAQILGMRRHRPVATVQCNVVTNDVKDKICLNLFFDEQDLVLPIHKHSEYGAHEVLQMKPVVAKGDTYAKFLKANSWVYQKFPNAKSIVNRPTFKRRGINFLYPTSLFIEFVCKTLQLSIIHRHQTSEIITETQLWFFPDDFEKKMKKSKS